MQRETEAADETQRREEKTACQPVAYFDWKTRCVMVDFSEFAEWKLYSTKPTVHNVTLKNLYL